MSAVLSLGTVGYGVALMYALLGAPDLAMTLTVAQDEKTVKMETSVTSPGGTPPSLTVGPATGQRHRERA